MFEFGQLVGPERNAEEVVGRGLIRLSADSLAF